MSSQNKKGLIFFTADSLIAGGIFVATVVILLAFYSEGPVASDTKTISNELVDYITETDIHTINTQYKYMYFQPNDNLSNHKIHERIAYHVDSGIENDINRSRNLLEHIVNRTVPLRFGFEYVYDNVSVFNRTSPNVPRTNLTASIATFYLNEDKNLVGPKLTEVRVWS